MTLEEAEKLDNILLRFQNIEGVGTSQLKNEDVRKRYKLLQAKGYITLMEMSGEDRIASVTITPGGIAFINEGGFKKVVQKEKEGNEIQKLQKDNLELSNKVMEIEIANKELKEENLKLTNSNLRFENSIKFWKAVSLALGISTSVFAFFTFFK